MTPATTDPDIRSTPQVTRALIPLTAVMAALIFGGALLSDHPTSRAAIAAAALWIGLSAGAVTIQVFHGRHAPSTPLIWTALTGLAAVVYSQQLIEPPIPEGEANVVIQPIMLGALLLRVLRLPRAQLGFLDQVFTVVTVFSALIDPLIFLLPALGILGAYHLAPRFDRPRT